MLIDAHLQLWRDRRDEFPSIAEADEALRRDFLPLELEPELDLHGFDGGVAIQAAPGPRGTRWLLELCAPFPFLRGVVGWIDLFDGDLESRLDLFAEHPCFSGVRLVVPEAAGSSPLEGEALDTSLDALSRRRLTCDLRLDQRSLSAAAALAARHPSLSLVLDSLAPRSPGRENLRCWGRELFRLAAQPNVSGKVAGLVACADRERWTPEELRPILELAFEAFGTERLMFGSDWPVCRLAANYASVTQLALDFAAELSPTERAAFLGGNATRFYHLPR